MVGGYFKNISISNLITNEAASLLSFMKESGM